MNESRIRYDVTLESHPWEKGQLQADSRRFPRLLGYTIDLSTKYHDRETTAFISPLFLEFLRRRGAGQVRRKFQTDKQKKKGGGQLGPRKGRSVDYTDIYWLYW